MFYKVIDNGNVIDVLDNFVYLKYQPKHGHMLFCEQKEAEAILSSDGTEIWHLPFLRKLPVDGYKTVEVVEIDEYEYKKYKVFCGKSIEKVIDEFVYFTLNNKELLIESLKRLYQEGQIDEFIAMELRDNGIITNKEWESVLGN